MLLKKWLPDFNIYVWLIAFFCILETLCFTYLQNFTSLSVFTAAGYFISGLAICILGFLSAQGLPGKLNNEALQSRGFTIIKYLTVCLFFLFVAYLLIDAGSRIFPANPLNYKQADMLPLIRTACERWLNGQPVYTPVKEVWGGENIPYFPAMWMPFAPAVWMQLDLRWTSVVLGILIAALILLPAARLGGSRFNVLGPVVFLLLFMVVKYYTWENVEMLMETQEMAPIFFYLVLFCGLMYENAAIVGFGLACCTLSRFSLLPFIPFYFLWLLLRREYGKFIKTGLVYGFLLAVLFVFPFFIKQPWYFINIPFHYMSSVEAYCQANHYSITGRQNLGLAFIFGYKHHEAMEIMNKALMILAPACWLVAYFVISTRKRIDAQIWAIAGLKLSLVFFYNFISMPYLYLFVVPTMVSYPLLIAVARKTGSNNLNR